MWTRKKPDKQKPPAKIRNDDADLAACAMGSDSTCRESRVHGIDPARLLLDTTDGQAAVSVSELLYVESRGHYLAYITTKGEYLVRGSITEHEKSLREHHFERVQKSFLVNLAKIENIKTAELIVAGVTIPIGKLYRDSLKSVYMRYIKG